MIKYYLSPYIFSITNGYSQLFLDLLKIIFILFFSSKELLTNNYLTITKYNDYEGVKKECVI